MAKSDKDQPLAVEPATMPEVKTVVEQLTPVVHTVDANSPEVSGPVPVDGAARAVKNEVRTGVDIRTGKPVMKAIPPKKAAAVNWNTGDRAPYVAHTAGEGSLNGRAFKFKAGDTINLNADESKLFAAYVTKVVK